MRLLHLRIACYLYDQFTDFDYSYLKLSEKYQNLNLNETEHVKALIEWLRSWGCRQFKSNNEDMSTNSIMDWYKSIKSRIPSRNDCLIDYDLVANRELIIEVFNNLLVRKAATRQRGDREINVRIGPVGTAKTLFALRPNLFSPWDAPIYNKFQLEGNGCGYIKYLSRVQNELREIRDGLKHTNINWNELFGYLKKQHKSYPKLIDEYYWITITQGCDPLVIDNFCNNQTA